MSIKANMKMAKMMGDTSEVIKQMNSLMNVKELTGTMKDIQKSMMQFGLMNEMVEDAMGVMDDDADVDMDERVSNMKLNVSNLFLKELDQIIDSVKNPEKYKQKDAGLIISADQNADDDLDDLQNQLRNMA